MPPSFVVAGLMMLTHDFVLFVLPNTISTTPVASVPLDRKYIFLGTELVANIDKLESPEVDDAMTILLVNVLIPARATVCVVFNVITFVSDVDIAESAYVLLTSCVPVVGTTLQVGRFTNVAVGVSMLIDVVDFKLSVPPAPSIDMLVVGVDVVPPEPRTTALGETRIPDVVSL
jgi:hypothetical protein